MTYLIDRRLQGKNKSAINRERFLRRYKGQIKDAVGRAIKPSDAESKRNPRARSAVLRVAERTPHALPDNWPHVFESERSR